MARRTEIISMKKRLQKLTGKEKTFTRQLEYTQRLEKIESMQEKLKSIDEILTNLEKEKINIKNKRKKKKVESLRK